MNKKHLSVVMAGAMLATTVAPVLAAETTVKETEVTKGNAGLLIDRLDNLLASKKFDATDRNVNGNSSDVAGTSVYRIQILTADGNGGYVEYTDGSSKAMNLGEKSKSVNVFKNTDSLKLLLKANNKNEYKVVVWELGNRTDDKGRVVSTGEKDTTKVEYTKVTKDYLTNILDGKANNFEIAKNKKFIVKAEENEDKSVTITLASKNTNGEFNTITLKEGDDAVDFSKPIDSAGIVLSDTKLTEQEIQEAIAGFEKIATTTGDNKVKDIFAVGAKEIEEINVVNGDVKVDVNLDDLYDGLMLTEKGHQLLEAVKATKKQDSKVTYKAETIKSKGSERSVELIFENRESNTTTVVKVVTTATKEGDLNKVLGFLNDGKADIDILAGENRYATAVEIAKTYLTNVTGKYDKLTSSREVVLVNGEALVDGLAAAPYARKKNAPILLTSDSKLPKETKAYLKELLREETVGSLDKVTVTIIGGEAVVSQNVVNELKEIGFKVKRLAGDNREETSIAVADKMGSSTKAYVVGGNGEADAMSIAPVAAVEEAPIIVTKSADKLSNAGLNELNDYSEVEIVGGEAAVSKNVEDVIKEEVNTVSRLSGKNRQETNALVIKKHYASGFDKVLVAKDGQRNKSELVDALPVSLFATTNKVAPIVLATDKLSDEQINQITLNAEQGTTIYQVGHGVNRTVIETLAHKLNIR